MVLESDGEPSPKRLRVDEEGEQAAAAEVAVDRISQLPKELLLRILAFLPLTLAIRTGTISTVWRGLWRHRWMPPSSLRLRVSDRDTPERLLASLKLRGTRRIDRFSLTFSREGGLEVADFSRFLDYAAACAAEDLFINFRTDHVISDQFTFDFPEASPLLERVSLRGVVVNLSLDGAAHPFSALGTIHLHSVEARDGSVRDLAAACPRLHTLDLRDCSGGAFHVIDVRPAGAHLRSLTVARCDMVRDLFADTAGLRSFRYSGGTVIEPSCISANAPLDDLCISFSFSLELYSSSAKFWGEWRKAIANFSNLTVLTICSSFLPKALSSADIDLLATVSINVPRSAPNLRLQNLKELHLLLSFGMDDAMLNDIYEFFRTCRCPQLERLFIQLDKRPSENMEVDAPFDELSEEEGSVEELPQEAPSKEVPLEELSKEEAPVDELAEDKAIASVYEQPKNELSEELLEDDLENLMLVKIVNFDGLQNEMKLVSSLLIKATSLGKLILVVPKKEGRLDKHHYIETKLLLLRKASKNAKIILTESDDAATQPVHSKVTAEFFRTLNQH